MTVQASGIRAPSHLAAATRRWWEQLHRDYQLEEHHSRLATLAAEAWDRGQEAREAMELMGRLFTTLVPSKAQAAAVS